MRVRSIGGTTGLAVVGALALGGCGGGELEAYCEQIQASPISAVIYAPYIATEPPAEWAGARLEVLEGLEAPEADLADDLDTWRGYLEDLSALDASDPAAFDLDTEEVTAAQDALLDHYTEQCL